ncbi:MAG: sulfurtransferase [Oceanospirillales bacterium]|nr:sulfurtransferase [Oceanospirillales bacterium]
MKKLLSSIVVSAALMATVMPAQASEVGITPQATYDLVQQDEQVLFIDVRDPVEIMFIGFTDSADLNIPYLMVDRTQWDSDKNRFRLYQNPKFIQQIEQALEARGLDHNATIITLCRSGSERGLPSANYLIENGFKNARYVINGFQGSSVKEGDKKGFRIQNGWQNSSLPWQAKPNPDKIHRVDR